MNKPNFKQLKETTKTIVLTALIAAVPSFVAGVQYTEKKHEANNKQVMAQLEQLKK